MVDQRRVESEQEQTTQPEPVIIIYPTGQVVIGAGYNIGTVLDALVYAQRTVRGIVPRQVTPPEVAR